MDDDRDSGTDINPQVLTAQIIAGAMIVGVLVFATVTLALGAWNVPERDGPLKTIGLVLVPMIAVPFVLVPSTIASQGIQRPTSGEGTSANERIAASLGVYQMRMIVRLSLLEGAAFLNLIAFLTEHARWSLGIAGVLLVAMLVIFPTRTRIEHWVETQQLQFSTRREDDAEHPYSPSS